MAAKQVRLFCMHRMLLLLWVGNLALHSAPIAVAQQEESNSPRARPNPFRTGSVGATRTESADVIRLEKLPLNTDPPVVTAISISPDSKYLAAAGDDHAIRIVEMATGKTTRTLSGHLDWVQCVEYSPSGRLLASCGNDGSLRIWSIESEPRLLFMGSAEHALLTLAFAGEDSIYVAGFGNNIYRWTHPATKLVVDHACECKDIRSIACSRDQTRIAYGGRDGVLRVRRIESNAAKRSSEDAAHSNHDDMEVMIPLHFDRIRSLQFSLDGNQITSVGEDRRIVHYDLIAKKTTGQTEIGGGKLMGLCQLEPHLFAIAGSDNSIRIFNDRDQQVLIKLIGHDGSVSVLKRTPTHIVSGSFDTTIRMWDIERALAGPDKQGRYIHPVAAQFEDSGAGDSIK
jgi:WD40 repeat protein